MRKSLIVAVLIVLAVAGWLSSGLIDGHRDSRSAKVLDQDSPSAEVKVEPLTRVRTRLIEAQSVPERIILLGSTEAKRRVRLRAQTAAAVTEVLASRGEIVKRGDLIVRLASDDRPARLRQARALLKQPDMLIVNEAVGSLDPTAQTKVVQDVTRFMAGRGIAWVVERADLASEFEQVLVMDGGRITQQGSYAELSVTPGAFKQMLEQ